MSVLATLVSRGTRAAQPAATAVSAGSLYYVTDESKIERANGSTWDSFSGKGVVQSVCSQTGAVNSGSTIIPSDDTIPQNTEGDEYFSQAITPTSATNVLEITAVLNISCLTAVRNLTVALFQDTGANALACSEAVVHASGYVMNITLKHRMTAGTTSAMTFKIRAGVDTSGTCTLNGRSGVRIYGGVCISSLTIHEMTP